MILGDGGAPSVSGRPPRGRRGAWRALGEAHVPGFSVGQPGPLLPRVGGRVSPARGAAASWLTLPGGAGEPRWAAGPGRPVGSKGCL